MSKTTKKKPGDPGYDPYDFDSEEEGEEMETDSAPTQPRPPPAADMPPERYVTLMFR